jgi:sugar phosphate permease
MEKFTNLIKPILALIIITFSFAYFLIVTFSGKENPQILIAIVAMDSAVIGYFFGASSGSTKKDEAIQTMIDKQ